MSIYLIINIAIILIPLLMSFEKKIKFYKNFPFLFGAIFIVGTVFILWDIIATYRNDWSFNSDYTLGLKIINLPLEEILFFITVPFASIFIYETFKYYFNEKTFTLSKKILYVVLIFFFIVSFITKDKYYTSTISFFCGLFFFTIIITKSTLLNSKIFWYWIVFTYIPFFIVNYILTSLPIVIYSDSALLKIRIITIPIEDFFYSFALLSFNLFFYLKFKETWQRKKLQ